MDMDKIMFYKIVGFDYYYVDVENDKCGRLIYDKAQPITLGLFYNLNELING
jgi:hypothetical protein